MTSALGDRSTADLSVAIVVPARNEVERLGASLARLRADFPGCELVVVDGDSEDDTAAVAASFARVLACEPGRGRQMNKGAAATASDVLWFVHADVVIDADALTQLRAALSDPEVVGGGLSLRFDQRNLGLDYLAWSSTQRARHLHQIFGDQSMFVRRSAFVAVGGFPEIALMEDFELSRRLRHRGRLVVLGATSTASARRFEEHGTWSMIAFMQYLKVLHFIGVDPSAIAARYAAGPIWTHKRWRRKTWEVA